MKRVLLNGRFRERLSNCWLEMKENIGRSALQTVAIVLGVASVLGGFSLMDSQMKNSKRWQAKYGGMDKINAYAMDRAKLGNPSPLEGANLGLRVQDVDAGLAIKPGDIQGATVINQVRLRVRSPHADQPRMITGGGEDYVFVNGYKISAGRLFNAEDMAKAHPVALLGSEAAMTFFPYGDALGQTIKLGDNPVQVIGILSEKVFREGADSPNYMRRFNKVIHVPASFIHQRVQGDAYGRVGSILFKIPNLAAIKDFSEHYTLALFNSHRQQKDFRLDDLSARMRSHENQNNIYNLVFMLSGILSLVGGGIVNINIQLASLKERVREVGMKMAIGADGREIFKEFMTEALFLTVIGSMAGLALGIGLGKVITWKINTPFYLRTVSFFWAFLLAMISGFLFALFPAWKASRQSPMEALRYE